MLKSVLGAISADMAVDLGSANTRIHVSGRGVMIHEPTALAMMDAGERSKRILAVGLEAQEMEGRCPRDIEVIRPVQQGQVVDFESLESMLRHWVLQVQGRRLWVGPRMAFVIPYGTTDVEQRALRESAEAAGAREVILVEQPLAASIGCDLPVHAAKGQMLFDIGASTTSVSVVSLGGVAYACTIPVGGRSMDREILLYLRDERGLHISMAEAEKARIRSVSFARGSRAPSSFVRGRDVRSGFPRALSVESEELTMALEGTIGRLSDAMLQALEKIPAELATDVAELGILMAGGCARTPGLDQAVGRAAGLPLVTAEQPDRVAVLGACRLLTDPDLGDLVAG
jgi:rod shape-determining protein MreB